MTTPQRPQSGHDEWTDPLESRVAYVIGGAFFALFYGGLKIAGFQRELGANVGIALVAVTAAGGLVGLELHATRSWADKGDLIVFGRWVLAFLSAAVTVGSALHVFGYATRVDYYWLLLASVVLGGLWGAQVVSDAGRERARKYREWRRRRGQPDE